MRCRRSSHEHMFARPADATECRRVTMPRAMAILLTWNVAGRVGPNQERQIAALAGRAFDVLCLQEVTPRTRERWIEALEARGLHVAVSECPVPPAGTRRFAVLVASRWPVRVARAPVLPWPERYLGVRSAIDGREVE